MLITQIAANRLYEMADNDDFPHELTWLMQEVTMSAISYSLVAAI